MVNFLEYKAPGGKSKIIRGRDCNNKGRAHKGKMEVSKSSFEAYDMSQNHVAAYRKVKATREAEWLVT